MNQGDINSYSVSAGKEENHSLFLPENLNTIIDMI
jgi:hypothetical protein